MKELLKYRKIFVREHYFEFLLGVDWVLVMGQTLTVALIAAIGGTICLGFIIATVWISCYRKYVQTPDITRDCMMI
jgi:hypothetical protein